MISKKLEKILNLNKLRIQVLLLLHDLIKIEI
jgi:hypothetical protein